MLKKYYIITILLFFTSICAQNKNEILGNWMATDNSVMVQVFTVNKEYRAKVLWFDERLGSGKPMNLRTDTANPNPNLRKRKIIGMEILHGLRYDSTSRTWENGKIYDGSSGRTWDSAASFTDNGILKVRGYWKFKWIGKTMYFSKVI